MVPDDGPPRPERPCKNTVDWREAAIFAQIVSTYRKNVLPNSSCKGNSGAHRQFGSAIAH
jgi:hypothetical protein